MAEEAVLALLIEAFTSMPGLNQDVKAQNDKFVLVSDAVKIELYAIEWQTLLYYVLSWSFSGVI